MKKLFSIILFYSVVCSPFSWAMNQAERAGMKLIKPGLWVNASNQTVYVAARATEIKAGEPCEFILIGNDSGHGYESLFSTKILPSEIQAAFEELGFEAGVPSDASAYRFWPKGERVTLNVHFAPPNGRPLQSLPPESFIIDRDSQQTLSAQTWTFTGCLEKDNTCLSDQDIQAIVATYNEPYSIFCPPGQADKSSIYGTLLRNSKNPLPKGHAVMLSISPEKRSPENPRLVDATLHFRLENGTLFNDIGFAKQKAVAHRSSKPGSWIPWFKEHITPDQDWHVNILFDPQLALDKIHILSSSIRQIEGESGIRIGPPAPEQLYYKSFIPNPQLRARSGRPHQPIELHIRRYAEHYTSTLMLLEEKWSKSKNQFEIAEDAFKAPSPKALEYLLKKHHFPSDVAFIYCPANMLLADLREFTKPLLDTVNVVYVFLTAAHDPNE